MAKAFVVIRHTVVDTYEDLTMYGFCGVAGTRGEAERKLEEYLLHNFYGWQDMSDNEKEEIKSRYSILEFNI